MKTYLRLKDNKRFPENSFDSSFRIEKGKLNYFIRGQGWKKAKKNEFVFEEILDLQKPFTDEQFKEYSLKYGIECSMQFLDCADICKYSTAYRIINPPKNKDKWNQLSTWFNAVFEEDLFNFMDGYVLGLANTYMLDIIKFEKHLAFHFNYPMNQDGSMRDFISKMFGEENTVKFESLLK